MSSIHSAVTSRFAFALASALLLLLAIGPTLAACSPSQNAIQTAIAQTQAALPTSTVTPKPAPTMTPTPILFTGDGKNYIPSASEMPSGFELDAKSSGPIQMDNGKGYAVTYMNPANIASASGDAVIVTFQVYNPSTEEEAQAIFKRLSTEAAEHMSQTMPGATGGQMVSDFKPVEVTISDIDETSAIMGTIQGPLFPTTVINLSLKSKNLVTAIFVAGTDLGDSSQALLNQATFYASLVVDKLNK